MAISRRKKIERALDALAREIVMLRIGAKLIKSSNGTHAWFGFCQWCGKERWLQWCHIHPQGRYPHIRWDADNAVAMCAGCHMFKWHRDPYLAEQFITNLLGVENRAALASRAMQHVKIDRIALRQYLEQELARLKARNGES